MSLPSGTPPLGIVEGYYGTPYSWAERADMVAFLAPHGYEFFLYAPKFDEYLRRTPVASEDQEFKADLGYFYAASGRRAEALAIARELISRQRGAGEAVGGSIAAVYSGLDQRAEALSWLDRAVASKDPEVGYLLVDAKWDHLRDEPRFQQILTTLGFNPRSKE